MFDWNDLKAFLAVARAGSTLAAAKALSVNQTTIARRMEALETAIGLKLIERGQAGSRLTEAGEALLPEAEAVEKATEGFAHQARALHRGVTGSLRVTINESLANVFLAPALAEFRRLYPDIKVEMLVGDTFLDVAKGEADVAIRGTTALVDSDLVSRRLTHIPWAIYGSLDYVLRHGRPIGRDDFNDHVLVGGEGRMVEMPALKWLSRLAPRAEVHTRSNSLTNLMVAVKAGLGLAPLPMLVADHEPDLVRMTVIDDLPSATYLLTRADLKDTPRVRAFLDFLTPNFLSFQKAMTARGDANQAELAREIARRLGPREAEAGD